FGRRAPGHARRWMPRSYDRFDYQAGSYAGRRGDYGTDYWGDYGADYWWLGERAFDRYARDASYDESYRRFSATHHPRFTPVGGMYPAIGGYYAAHRPRPLREPTWFSDWTRWF